MLHTGRTRIAAVGLTLVAGVLLARSGGAQIVNVLGQVRKAKEGFSLKGLVGVDWRTGNTRLFVVSGGIRVAFKHERNLLFLVASGNLGYASGKKYVAKSFEHLRYRVRLLRRFYGETFFQHSFNEFGRLAMRLLYGIGPRLLVFEWQSGYLAVGSAWMLEVERLGTGVQDDSGQRSIVQRWSNYAELSYGLGESLTLQETVFYQPMFANMRDFRLLSELSLHFKIIQHLGFVTAFTLAYDSRPPLSVEKLDTTLKSSVTFTF